MNIEKLLNLIVVKTENKYSKLTSITKAVQEFDSAVKAKEVKEALENLNCHAQSLRLEDKKGKSNNRNNVYAVTVNNKYDFIKPVTQVKYEILSGHVYDFELISFDDKRAYFRLHLVNKETAQVFNLFIPSADAKSFNKIHKLKNRILGVCITAKAYKKGVANFNVKSILNIDFDEYSNEIRNDYKIENSKFLANKISNIKDDATHLASVAQLDAIDISVNQLKTINELTIVTRGLIFYLKSHANSCNLNYSLAKNSSYVAMPAFFEDFYEFLTESAMPELLYSRTQLQEILAGLKKLGVFKECTRAELTQSAKKMKALRLCYAVNKDTSNILRSHFSEKHAVSYL